MRPGRRRKTEITNCILKIRVNYETAISFIMLALPQLLDVRVHASLVEPPRRRSSCPHRFTTPNPSSPLPRIALEPELGLPRARERNRPPWPPPSPCTPCPHLRSSSDPTEPAVPSLTYHGTPELSPSPSPAPEAPPASMSAAAMVAAALLPRSSHLRSPFAQTEPGNRSTTSP